MGKRTTTTREYDSEGRLVRETVLEETIQQFTIFPMGHIAGCRCSLCRPDLQLPWKVEHTACVCPVWPCPMHHLASRTFQLSANAGAADNHTRSHEAAGIGKQWLSNNAGVSS